MRRSHHIDLRGNSHNRRRRREWLLSPEAGFGGDGKRVPCYWCGKRLRTRFECDRHPDPRGTYRRGNVVPACGRCNRRRGMGLPPVPGAAFR